MPDFKYKGILKDGTKIKNIIPAQSKLEAIEKLKKSNIQPIKIKIIEPKGRTRWDERDKQRMVKAQTKKNKEIEKVSKYSKKFRLGMSVGQMLKSEIRVGIFEKVRDKEIISFMNSLYILKKAQFNNIQALKSIYETTESPAFRDVIEDVLSGVESGERMHTMMSHHPKVFDPMVVSFIRVGEETGTLDSALLYARDYIESSQIFKKQIRAAIVPKLLQFIIIMLLMVIAVVYGVPILEDVYAMFGSTKQIPETTLIAVDIFKWIGENWILFVGGAALILSLFQVYIRTAKGRYSWDKFKFTFPVVGRLLTSMTISNFFQAMLLNLRNGMRIDEALAVSKGVTKNYYFLSIVEVARNRGLAGESWITPFDEKKIFTPMVTEMLTIGMETDLPEMMEKVNDQLNIQIKDSVDRFTRWLPNITYGIVGVALIVFCLVVLVPVIEVYMGSFITY